MRGGADGVFGTATVGAVITFQRARGLPATGKVDPATAAAPRLSPMTARRRRRRSTIRLQAKPVQGPCFYVDTWGGRSAPGGRSLGVDIGAAHGNRSTPSSPAGSPGSTSTGPGSLAGNGLKIALPDGTYIFYAHL